MGYGYNSLTEFPTLVLEFKELEFLFVSSRAATAVNLQESVHTAPH